MEIRELYKIYLQHPAIVTDSRRGRPGSIFFGLRGEHFDGSLYAGQALEMGCDYAVVDNREVNDGERIIRVDNSLSTLQKLASWHRQQLEIPVLGITGSNGKTTTKELISGLLATKYEVMATRGNLNNHIGVPLTLLSVGPEAEIAVIEMGANHAGEIGFLCGLARPDYGLITNVGHAHLEGFGSFEGVRRAKSELYRFIGENGGLIFCNGADPDLRGMLEGIDAEVSWYGNVKGAAVAGEVIALDPYLTLRIRIPGQDDREVRTGLVGAYNLENILAAVAVSLHFRVRPESILARLNGWSSSGNRSQRLETERNILIMDAYNANPTSMKAALDNFSRQEHPSRVLILGDMLELGDTSYNAHSDTLKYIKSKDFEKVFLVGPIFSSMADITDDIHIFADVEELSGWLERNPLEGHLILLKGSRGIGLERLKDKL